ncbi:MAG TPA: MBL fold metallo-hydrolase [Thermoanaerobaculales bacterium]|nr:MBL fold metallo-hydrolase [Thermoanaerobaculales bacterium]HQP42823.1 MBL fold metallo-hydrolase [Thermoanaerobaculales bacterium]
MRCLARCAAVSLLLAGSVLVGEAAEPPAYELVEVSDSVVMAINANGSNIACVALGEGLLFVDASLSTRIAESFRRDMEARFQRPALALLVTHAHLDHILGMGAFADLPVIAAEAGRPRWERYLAVEWDDRTVAGLTAVFPTFADELPSASLRMPTQWFEESLELGGERVVVRRTGGHSADSSSVVLAGERVVVAGDLVQARRRPYFGEPDTDMNGWIETLRSWERMAPVTMCPGHGPVIGGDELAVMRSWFEAMSQAVAKLKASGATFDEVVASDRLPSGYWPAESSVPGWWPYCVKRLYDAT